MFKKNEEARNIEDLKKSELVKIEIEYSRTEFGKKLYHLTLLPVIMTFFTVFYVLTTELANGYVNIGNIGIILMIGLGLSSIVRILYYQNLARYYKNLRQKK